jgi:cyclophilin family peptidyl-prolyl cis-trans isomerase
MNFARRIAIVSLAAALPLAAYSQDKGACAPKDGAVKVKLTTSMGPITLALDPAKAPITTDNFVKYVSSGFYNGTIFHRVMDGFMIQGGGMTKDMTEKPTNPPIKNEGANGLKNDEYTVAMARRPDPDSATAQFFINVKNNDMLNAVAPRPGYAVFGKVVDGKETVDKIKKVATGNHPTGHQNVPTTPVVIEKAECI